MVARALAPRGSPRRSRTTVISQTVVGVSMSQLEEHKGQVGMSARVLVLPNGLDRHVQVRSGFGFVDSSVHIRLSMYLLAGTVLQLEQRCHKPSTKLDDDMFQLPDGLLCLSHDLRGQHAPPADCVPGAIWTHNLSLPERLTCARWDRRVHSSKDDKR